RSYHLLLCVVVARHRRRLYICCRNREEDQWLVLELEEDDGREQRRWAIGVSPPPGMMLDAAEERLFFLSGKALHVLSLVGDGSEPAHIVADLSPRQPRSMALDRLDNSLLILTTDGYCVSVDGRNGGVLPHRRRPRVLEGEAICTDADGRLYVLARDKCLAVVRVF